MSWLLQTGHKMALSYKGYVSCSVHFESMDEEQEGFWLTPAIVIPTLWALCPGHGAHWYVKQESACSLNNLTPE